MQICNDVSVTVEKRTVRTVIVLVLKRSNSI